MKHVSLRSHQPTALQILSTVHEKPLSRGSRILHLLLSTDIGRSWIDSAPLPTGIDHGSSAPPFLALRIILLWDSRWLASACAQSWDRHSFSSHRFWVPLQCLPTEDGDVCFSVSIQLCTNGYLIGGQTNFNSKQSTPQTQTRSCLLAANGKCPLSLTGLRFSPNCDSSLSFTPCCILNVKYPHRLLCVITCPQLGQVLLWKVVGTLGGRVH